MTHLNGRGTEIHNLFLSRDLRGPSARNHEIRQAGQVVSGMRPET